MSKAQEVELEWNGSEYSATLTDTNGVLSKYTFTANVTGMSFSVSGNDLTITTPVAPEEQVVISATKEQYRTGIIVWGDGLHQSSGKQDTVTYSASVSDPVKAYINLAVSFGSAKIIKTSEDGKVDGITFTITGEGINETVKTNSQGEITIISLFSDFTVSVIVVIVLPLFFAKKEHISPTCDTIGLISAWRFYYDFSGNSGRHHPCHRPHPGHPGTHRQEPAAL